MKRFSLVVAQFYLDEDEIRRHIARCTPKGYTYELCVIAIDQRSAALDMSVLADFLQKEKEENWDNGAALIFFNDTLFIKYFFPFYIRRLFQLTDSLRGTQIPVGVGEIQAYLRIELGARLPHRYVSTFTLGLNSEAMKIVKDSTAAALFEPTSPAQQNKRLVSSFLGDWVTHQQPQFRGAEPRLRNAKAMAVSMERIISETILNSGALVDVHQNRTGRLAIKGLNRLIRRLLRIKYIRELVSGSTHLICR